MSEKIKIGFVPASRSVFSQELAAKSRAETIAALKAAGIEPIVPNEDMTPLGLVESFDDAEAVAALFRREKVSGVIIGAMNFGNEMPAVTAAVEGAGGNPIFIFGCTEEGELSYHGDRRDALCGLLSIATGLRQRQVKFMFPKVANCSPKDPDFIEELKNFAAVCGICAGVRGKVYGQFGPRPMWFETCAFDELSLLRKFGIRTVPIPLSEIFHKANSLAAGDVAESVASIKSMFDVEGIPENILERLARLETVLLDAAETHNMAAMALQCWDSMQDDYGVCACSVMARINELRGIPVACEVDIHGALSMHMLALATGNTAILMDWNNRHYKEKDVFSAWHCGVLPNCVCDGGCKLRSNALTTKLRGGPDLVTGVLDGTFKSGPVTMARVTETPEGAWKLLIVEGEVGNYAGNPPGGNAWIKVADFDKLYRALLSDFPHHGGLVQGHAGKALIDAAKFLGLEVVAPLPLKGVE
jgi:L-fucose isomerase-like protein